MTRRAPTRASSVAAEVRAAVSADARLMAAHEHVRRRTGLSAERVRELWDDALFDVLDILGDGYVEDQMAARSAVERVADRLHEIRERAAEGRLTEDSAREMAEFGEALREYVLAISDPQRWARDHPGGAVRRHADGVVPARTPAERARNQRRNRVLALTEEKRTAFELAQSVAPERLEAVVRGEPKAAAALRRELAGHMNDWAVDRVLDAVGEIRDPGLDYALGAGIGGSRTGPVAVNAAYRDLPSAQRNLVRQAIVADPDFVRAAVTAETQGAFRGELDRFCAEHGSTGDRRATLEIGLSTLNEAHRRSLRTGDTALAHTRARILDRAASELGLPPRDEITRRLARSSVVVEIASRGPGHLEKFVDDWLRYAVGQRREGKPVATLERYVRALSRRHVKGLFGELTATFQLAEDAWVIKVPGVDVTTRGTDYVLVRANGEMWIGDNKALAALGLGKVSSLVENLADNLEADLAEFGQWLHRDDTPLPPTVSAAIQRLSEATVTVRGVTRGLSDEALKADRVQRRVTRILGEKGVRRIVSNSAGDLSWLTGSLRNHLDFLDLREAGPHVPERPLEPRPADVPAPHAADEGTEP